MPLPDPDTYTDWKTWAKAAALTTQRAERVKDNHISEYSPITDFNGNWSSDPEHPLGYCILKNGLIALSGNALCDPTHGIFGILFTLPKAAWPLAGHTFAPNNLIMTEVSGWRATYSAYPIFINSQTGAVSGMFTVSSYSILFFDSVTFRGAVSR